MVKELKVACWFSNAPKSTLKLKFIVSIVFDTIYPVLVTTGWFFNTTDIFGFVDSFTAGLAIYQVLCYTNFNICDFILFLTTLLQAYFKIVMLYVGRNEFADLFHRLEKFWPVDKFDKKSKKIIVNIQRKTVQILKTYKILLCSSGFIYLLKPLFERRKVLSVAWYSFCSFEDNKCYIGNYILQGVYISRFILSIYYFDNLFFIFLSYSYCELEQVKYGLLHLNVYHRHVLRQMAALVRQHNRALE